MALNRGLNSKISRSRIFPGNQHYDEHTCLIASFPPCLSLIKVIFPLNLSFSWYKYVMCPISYVRHFSISGRHCGRGPVRPDGTFGGSTARHVVYLWYMNNYISWGSNGDLMVI